MVLSPKLGQARKLLVIFRVGAAAGTVAKTMSAYDMAMSDAIYGKERAVVTL